MKMDPPFRVYTFKMLAKLVFELLMVEEKPFTLQKEDIIAFNEVFLHKRGVL